MFFILVEDRCKSKIDFWIQILKAMISLHEKSHSFLPFFGAWQPKLQEEIPRFLLQFIAFL